MPFPESNEFTLKKSGDTTNIHSSSEFHQGQSVGGRYTVISRIGEGGMGLVYRVNQVFLNKELALKTLDRDRLSEAAVRRFQQEARTTFSLDHPSIISVKDFGVLEDGTPFLAMELLKGETLGNRLKRAGALPLDQAIAIFVQVCFGLAYAHDLGIVHRDIKPSNIMLLNGLPLGAEGSVKILDFGIAKLTGHEGGEIQELTRTGEIFGSPLYMSPEQCSGFKVDHRADIYSLGCVLFEALTGAPPFIGENALSTMIKHQSEKATTLREASMGQDFPKALEVIVAMMLEKSPERRYQNIAALVHDLGALKRGESLSGQAAAFKSSGITNERANVTPKIPPTVSMSRSALIGVITGTALVFGFAGFALHLLLENKFSTKQIQPSGATQEIRKESAAQLEQVDSQIAKMNKEEDQKIAARFSNNEPVVSVTGQGREAGRRVFSFLNLPIGQVCYPIKVNGKNTVKLVVAVGQQTFPPDVPLTLALGGAYSDSFRDSSNLKAIGKNEFEGLKLEHPEVNSFGEIASNGFLTQHHLLEQTNAILKIAKDWTNLHTVEIRSLPFDATTVSLLSSIRQLTFLDLFDIRLKDPAVMNKLSAINLEHMKISNCSDVKELVEFLMNCQKLKTLEVDHSFFSNALAPSKFEKLSISNLILSGTEVPNQTMRSILQIRNLKSIVIRDTKLSEAEKSMLKEASAKGLRIDIH